MSEIPRMTERHVEVLASAMNSWSGNWEWQEHVAEILSVIQGLADGSLRCADSTTEVVVNRQEIEEVLPLVEGLGWLGDEAETVYERASRWLSTPEQPETENRK